MKRAAARAGALVIGAFAMIGVTGVPVTPASAATSRYVAITIAGQGSRCVAWHAGMSGDTLLNDVARVSYRPSDGLITQINGYPRSNKADATHYWSFWTATGSRFVYASVGASGYHPAPGSLEGWAYVNGSPTATPPPATSYAAICRAVSTPSPTRPAPTQPAPIKPSSPPAASTHPTSIRPTSPAAASTSSSGTARPTPTRQSNSSTGVSAAAPTSGAAPTSSSAPTSSAAAGPAARTTDATPTLAPVADTHSHSSSATPAVVGGVLVALLAVAGGGTAWRRRRTRG